MRHIIIGDIHGCIDSFESLLTKLQPLKNDRIILLGDLFDRGDYSWEVFQKVKALKKEYKENFILLRGNHDDYLIQKNLSPALRRVWEHVGRGTSVDSFQAHGERLEDAAPWLEENCVLFFREKWFQCVHAGLRKEPIEENDLYTLIHDHGIALQNTYTGKLTVTGHIAVEDPLWFMGNGEVKVLKYDKEYPLPESGIICIDTGCGKGGILSAMVIEDRRFYLLHEYGSEGYRGNRAERL